MSHEILAKDSNHIVIVGWDGLLLTFYADVFQVGTNDRVKKIGTRPREIQTVSDLRARARKYGEFDMDVFQKLKEDKTGRKTDDTPEDAFDADPNTTRRNTAKPIREGAR